MIFTLYERVVVKVGDGERHVFDRGRLMFTEVREIEKVTGLSYVEWERELRRYSITAVAALLHILRKRDGMASDFLTMQFNVAELDVVPLREDGSEFTAAEVGADVERRIREAAAQADPTAAAIAAAPEADPQTSAPSTPASSPSGSGSAHGNGNGSPGVTSRRAKATSTAS